MFHEFTESPNYEIVAKEKRRKRRPLQRNGVSRAQRPLRKLRVLLFPRDQRECPRVLVSIKLTKLVFF